MNKTICMLGMIAASAGPAVAGGVDRSTQSAMALFETGNYAELTFGNVSPSVDGTEIPLLGGQNSGSALANYGVGSLAVKFKINETLDAAFIIDDPFGANTSYPTGTGYFAAGSTANLSTTSYTALLKYHFASNVSVFGGVRYQTLQADAFIPFVTPVPGVTPPYSVDGASQGAWGYVIGTAWERPDIAARVALTYNSAIDYDLNTTETSVLGTTLSQTPIKTPQSVNLEFQTGIAADTLLFGSVRWVNWSQFNISPKAYEVLTGGIPLVYYNGNSTTYTIGVGRKFTETWSGSVSYSHDTAIGGYSLNLGPYDGYDSVGLAAIYTQGAVKITAAVNYYALGDTQTQLGKISPASTFDGNSAVGVGVRIAYAF